MGSTNIFSWFLALTPILAIMILMLVFKWSASKAGFIGWTVAMLAALFYFKADFVSLSFSNAKGVLMALYVLYIIWGALILYHLVDIVGGIESIGATFASTTKNRVMLLLMIGFAFVSFLQGVAGFGVPVAVSGPILIGLGFDPITAIAVPLIGHSWSVTFGDMASSYTAIVKAAQFNNEQALAFAPWAAVFTGIVCLISGFLVVHVYGGFRAIKKNILPIIIVGASMALTQVALAYFGQVTLATFIAGIIGMIVTAALTRIPAFNKSEGSDSDVSSSISEVAATGENKVLKRSMGFNLAFAAYYTLIIIAVCSELIRINGKQVLNILQDMGKLSLKFPNYSTGLGWVTKAEDYGKVFYFGHAGSILIYSAIIGAIIYSLAGKIKLGDLTKVWNRTVKDGVGSSIATTSMVLMAFIMVESGMTYTLAKGVADFAGFLFPVFGSLVGVLGAFMTGSNTNSNVMFGNFQVTVAHLLGVSSFIMAAAQTAGGSIGSMVAPAKVIVGTSTVGLTGREGEVLSKTFKYAIILALLMGLVSWIFLYIIFPKVM